MNTRIICSQAERNKMVAFLSAIDNIEFVLTKASLHVSKKRYEIQQSEIQQPSGFE